MIACFQYERAALPHMLTSDFIYSRITVRSIGFAMIALQIFKLPHSYSSTELTG